MEREGGNQERDRGKGRHWEEEKNGREIERSILNSGII